MVGMLATIAAPIFTNDHIDAIFDELSGYYITSSPWLHLIYTHT